MLTLAAGLLLVAAFWLSLLRLAGADMRPGLQEGDLLLVNRLAYGLRLPLLDNSLWNWSSPARGDVVVFASPLPPGKAQALRVIGLPGERIDYMQRRLTINGRALPRRLVHDGRQRQFAENAGGQAYLTEELAQGPVFRALNLAQMYENDLVNFPDNCRFDMEDGQWFSCQVPAGHYLLLADNRDQSIDGRYWGFVSAGRIQGQVVARLWPAWR